MKFIHDFFLTGCILYLPAALAGLAGWKRLRNLFFLAAAAFLMMSAMVRIIYNWPLMCLFQEPYFVSLFVAVIAVLLYVGNKKTSGVAVGILSAVLSFFVLLFPGDIYSSFVKTNFLLAHFFSVFSSLARAAYLSSGVIAMLCLSGQFFPVDPTQEPPNQALIRSLVIVGFASQSIGMFCGAVWSYAGWGFPVRWESPLFLGMVGVWFYYSFFLHLHLEGGVNRKAILYAASVGAVLVFLFSFLPDTGVFNLRGFI
jgi:hypothetical protein